ncbi:MAG: glycosyltransferase [Flavobacteriales bacterium]
MDSISLTFVIATYNNASGVLRLLDQLCLQFPHASVVVVCDGSDTVHWHALQASPKKEQVKRIRLSKNFGQHAALLAGFKHCHTDVVITLDDDHEALVPHLTLLLVSYQQQPKDVIYAEFNVNYPVWRTVGRRIYRFLSGFWGKNHGRGSSVRLLSKSIYQPLSCIQFGFHFMDECLRWYTQEIAFVPVPVTLTTERGSRYGVFTLARLAVNKAFYASDKPLRWLVIIGVLTATLNFMVGSIMLYRKWMHEIEIPGYTSLIVGVLFSSGLLLAGGAVLAIYIRQILLRLNQTPIYHIKEVEP